MAGRGVLGPSSLVPLGAVGALVLLVAGLAWEARGHFDSTDARVAALERSLGSLERGFDELRQFVLANCGPEGGGPR